MYRRVQGEGAGWGLLPACLHLQQGERWLSVWTFHRSRLSMLDNRCHQSRIVINRARFSGLPSATPAARAPSRHARGGWGGGILVSAPTLSIFTTARRVRPAHPAPHTARRIP